MAKYSVIGKGGLMSQFFGGATKARAHTVHTSRAHLPSAPRARAFSLACACSHLCSHLGGAGAGLPRDRHGVNIHSTARARCVAKHRVCNGFWRVRRTAVVT